MTYYKWTKDCDAGATIHRMEIDPQIFIKIEKINSNYSVSVCNDGAVCGAVEYFDTFKQSKQFAERLASTKGYINYLLYP